VVGASDLFDSATYTDVPLVDATATYDAESGRAALFVANRSLTETARLEVDLRGIGGTSVLAATTLHAGAGQDRHATNAVQHDAVVPVRFDDHTVRDGRLTATLPALSWTVFELHTSR